jgi:hypothetical protein
MVKGKFNDTGIPWILVHSEEFVDNNAARDRELFIKSRK